MGIGKDARAFLYGVLVAHRNNADNSPMDEKWRVRINTARKQKGITLEDIADEMGVTPGMVSHWLTGKRNIWLHEFVQLCRYVVEDPTYILFGKDEPQPVAIAQDQIDSAVAKALGAAVGTPEHAKFLKKLRKARRKDRRAPTAKRRAPVKQAK